MVDIIHFLLLHSCVYTAYSYNPVTFCKTILRGQRILIYLPQRDWNLPSDSPEERNAKEGRFHFVGAIAICLLRHYMEMRLAFSVESISLNKNVWISIRMTLEFVHKGPINNIAALVQIMAWRRLRNKTLSEPMMVSSLTHICVIRP